MRISPHQHKSSPDRIGEDFYLSPAGAEGLGNQSSGGGHFFGRNPKSPDATGERFGILVLQEWCGKKRNGKKDGAPFINMWRAGCECGNEIVAPLAKFRRGYILSCGCIEKPSRGRNGATIGGKPTREYISWYAMKARCFDKRRWNYMNYGGRGITVCDRWRFSFANFLNDMGKKPGPGYSIDRIDNDGDYEPGNCRWATTKQQARNKRRYSLRREKAVHAPVSDHTRKRGRSVLSQLNGGPTVKKLVVAVILLSGMLLSGCIGDKFLGNVAESNVDAMESGRKQAMR